MHNLQPCEPQIQANLKECKYEPFALPSQKHANARLHCRSTGVQISHFYSATPHESKSRLCTVELMSCKCAFTFISLGHANSHFTVPPRSHSSYARPPEAGRLYFLKINTTSASLPSVASAESPSPSDSYLPTPSLSANLYPAALNSTSMESAKD